MIGLIVFAILLLGLIIPIRLWAKHYQKKKKEEDDAIKRLAYKKAEEKWERKRRFKVGLARIYFPLLKVGDKICDKYGMHIEWADGYRKHYITIIEVEKRSVTYKQDHNEQIITKSMANFTDMFAEGIIDYLSGHRPKEVRELYSRAEKSGQISRIVNSL